MLEENSRQEEVKGKRCRALSAGCHGAPYKGRSQGWLGGFYDGLGLQSGGGDQIIVRRLRAGNSSTMMGWELWRC